MILSNHDTTDLMSARLFTEDHIAEAARLQGSVHYQFRQQPTAGLLFNREDADIVLPAPNRDHSEAFFFCLRTGEQIYATADDILDENQMYEHWPLVEEADYEEITAFVGFDCFQCTHINQAESNNIVNGTWVRKWKRQETHGL